MNLLSSLIYNYFVLPLLFLAFHVIRIFNKKVDSAIKDRKTLFNRLLLEIEKINKTKKNIWFHSSSMGEFEQAKPIIEKLKSSENVNIIVTFFSPSGYNNSLKYSFADVISYIPFDTKHNIKNFIDIIKPNIAVFMRYDIWPNTIWELKERGIPSFIVDATMRENSNRKIIGANKFHKGLFSAFDKILTVSEEDKKNFADFSINDAKIKAVGDTRFDRVYGKSLQAKNKNILRDDIIKDKKVIVLGSSWESDEEVILPAIVKLCKYIKNILVIVVPHEPTVEHLEWTEHYLKNELKTIRFSYLNNYQNEQVIIIDSIGILLTLYYYADIAYVGGSFKQGIHNVLEPAVYGIPVVFGPKIQTSQEARHLVNINGGF
nr:glycosyltransferase N-terminal domain-containing protein [Melioribacteraceae bacterium]